MWSDKRVPLVLITVFGAAVAIVFSGACASSSEVRERRLEREAEDWAELEAHADRLFEALEQVAEARRLPISRRDASRRRLTTDWFEEDISTRRRYFLSVFIHPAGLAVRAHIVREAQQADDEGISAWQELPPTDEVTAEEGAIIEEAHRIWLDDDR